MSSTEGRQSPPPESQTGPQLKEAPAQGQGTDKFENKPDENKSQLESLSSNPTGPLDEAVKDKFTKTQK